LGAQQPEAKKPVEPLKFGPRDYFVARCQRCHGVDGTNYTAGFAKKDTDEMLRHDIDRMAKGAGNQPIKDDEIDVQMAYHRLMSDGKPFISWTGRKDLVLTGEVTDGAKLMAKIGDKTVDVKVDDDDHWKLSLASSGDWEKVVLTAEMEKKKTSLELVKSAYSKPADIKKTGSAPRSG